MMITASKDQCHGIVLLVVLFRMGNHNQSLITPHATLSNLSFFLLECSVLLGRSLCSTRLLCILFVFSQRNCAAFLSYMDCSARCMSLIRKVHFTGEVKAVVEWIYVVPHSLTQLSGVS
jgi:hypothetical protein